MARAGTQCRGNQQGAVLLVLLALLGALCGALLLVVNTGQQVSAKARLVNAADAAALSGAVWEARSLNLQAYMNRAMVANEVAIAQFVSLQSWSSYMNLALGKLSTYTTFVPYLGSALRALARIWAGVDRSMQATLPPFETLVSTWNADVLSLAEIASNEQAAVTARDIVRRAAQDNVADAQESPGSLLFAAQNLASWRAFTRRYTTDGAQRARLRTLIMNSRDGFSARRNWNASLDGIVSLQKRAGTDLIGYDAWRGLDTLSLHTASWLGDSETRLAWGGAELRQTVNATRGSHGGSWRVNPKATRRASSRRMIRAGYRGVPQYRDIAEPARRRALEVRNVVELQLASGRVGTSETLLSGAATVAGAGNVRTWRATYQHGHIYALAAAHVTFRRPTGRRDGRREYPSLFNPYWEARLTPVSREERQLAAPGKGLSIDPVGLLP